MLQKAFMAGKEGGGGGGGGGSDNKNPAQTSQPAETLQCTWHTDMSAYTDKYRQFLIKMK